MTDTVALLEKPRYNSLTQGTTTCVVIYVTPLSTVKLARGSVVG
jgi:hypothetical protein